MGADLYLRSISQPKYDAAYPEFMKAVKHRDELTARKAPTEAIEQAQTEVMRWHDAMYPDEGYFRDSYNSTSLFWRLDLSWWNDLKEFTDGDGNLPPSGSKRLLDLIKSKKLKETTRESLGAFAQIDEAGANSLEGWHNYFVAKKAKFEAFLQRAIDLNETIECSC